MIKNILIPENIGPYYLFSKIIIAIDITRTEIHATKIKISGNKKTIEKLIEEKIDNNNTLPYEERVIKSLKDLKEKLGKYDEIYACISSSSIIFKELSLPFLGQKKVKMVVPFEVESLLPFSLDQAIIDSVITKEDTKENKTDVLVAAIKKEQVDQFLNLFTAAGIIVNKLSVDMLELYGLYKSMPNYQHTTGTIALIDLGLYSTRVAIEIDNQLKYIRVFPKGIINIAKKIGSSGSDLSEIIQQIFRFGFNDDQSKDAFKDLLNEIKFTIESFTSKLKTTEQLKKVIITGQAVDIPSINEIITNTLEVNSEILQVKKIIHNGKVFSNISTIPNSFLISIATALSSSLTQDFNLQRDYVSTQEDSLINKQLIAFLSLLFLILTSFTIFGYLYIRNIKNIKFKAETEAIQELKKTFNLRERDIKTLKDANKAASTELKKQEEAWKQLSNENRYSFLKYLIELSSCLKPKEIQLTITSLNLRNNVIKLYGEVPGYNELNKLQNQLKCPLFKNVPKLQDPNFKAEPITLNISQDREA